MGRKRKEGEREPNGRLSRSLPTPAEQMDNLSVAVTARMKHWDLQWEDARDQKAATFIGILAMNNSITQAQYHAALDHKRDYIAFQRATCSTVEHQEDRELWDLSGEPDPIKREARYTQFCLDAISRWEEREEIIHKHATPRGQDFMRLCVLDNIPLWDCVEDGAKALEALLSHYRAPKKRAA